MEEICDERRMGKLRALLLEDSENDAFIVKRKLSAIADLTAVFSPEVYKSSLADQWDVILIDYNLSGMRITGEEAIALARKEHPETPVIVVSGSIETRLAVEAFKLGIWDYVFKDDLDKLPHVVHQAHESVDLKLKAMRGQRIELIGELAAGLSHDLNNIFHTIGAAEELLRESDPPQKALKLLDTIKSVNKRGAEMVKQLIAFARGMNGGGFKSVSAEFIISEIGQMLRAGTFPKNIRIETETVLGTSNVRCNETQVQQVLVNLAVNARDAMPNGGLLRVTAANHTINGMTSSGNELNGQFVCIEVSDTGSGIPDDALARIWEAFFTTKGNRGTGLGLSIVRSIVSDHGGGVDVHTGREGTVFSVYLPVADANANKKTSDPTDGTGKTIVFVDDEDSMRMLIPLQLQASNYKVLVAANGPEALNHFRSPVKIDLLLTDFSMPIMDGMQLIENLRAQNINIPAVLITGTGTEFSGCDIPVLKKPFSQEGLLKAVRDAIANG